MARCALCAAGRRGRSILLDFDTALVFPLNKYACHDVDDATTHWHALAAGAQRMGVPPAIRRAYIAHVS